MKFLREAPTCAQIAATDHLYWLGFYTLQISTPVLQRGTTPSQGQESLHWNHWTIKPILKFEPWWRHRKCHNHFSAFWRSQFDKMCVTNKNRTEYKYWWGHKQLSLFSKPVHVSRRCHSLCKKWLKSTHYNQLLRTVASQAGWEKLKGRGNLYEWWNKSFWPARGYQATLSLLQSGDRVIVNREEISSSIIRPFVHTGRE